MKILFNKRILTLCALALIAAMTSSVMAQNGGAILQIQGAGGTYSAPLSPQGSAKLIGVKPGNYQVGLLVPAVQKVRLAEGSSTASDDHSKWIELESWSWGSYYVGTANGGVWKTTNGGASREASSPSVSEIVVTKNNETQKSSPELWLKCAGTTVKLDQKITNAGQEYFRVKLTDILVTGAQPSSGNARPSESMSLNFEEIKYTVK